MRKVNVVSVIQQQAMIQRVYQLNGLDKKTAARIKEFESRYFYVGDLLQSSRKRLLARLKGVGPAKLDDIERCLAKCGLALGLPENDARIVWFLEKRPSVDVLAREIEFKCVNSGCGSERRLVYAQLETYSPAALPSVRKLNVVGHMFLGLRCKVCERSYRITEGLLELVGTKYRHKASV